MPEAEEVLVFPAAPAQQRLWFMDRFQPGNPAYNIAFGIRLHGDLDEEALRAALAHVIERHESLRTRFAVIDGEVAQIVVPSSDVPVDVTDLGPLEPQARTEALRDHKLAYARLPFDLLEGPLVRCHLFRLERRVHVFLIVLHHIVGDGWSFNVLLDELAQAYSAIKSNKQPSLPELPIQYPDFAIWQRDAIGRGDFEDQARWWKEHLTNVAALELPTDFARPPMQGTEGQLTSFTLPTSYVEGVRALATAEGTTPYVVLLAALFALLHRYTGQADLCIGTPIAGRARSELEPLIGFFVNTLVVRAELTTDPTFSAFVRHVKDSFSQAYSRADLPFDRIVEIARPKRDLSRAPLFQVMFSYHNTPMAQTRWHGLELELEEVHLGTAQFDLTLSIVERGDELAGTLEFCTALFTSETASRILGHFRELLDGALRSPGSRVSELPLLGEAERTLVLETWNSTAADYPRNSCVHELFEEQANANPDAPAVIVSNTTATYAQIDEQANAVANFLRGLGVGRDTPIAVCLDRSQLLVVALLGVLKAGGCYIPIDPAYPADRVALMLDDAKPPVLLTGEAHLERLPPFEGRRVCLDADWAEIEAAGTSRPPPIADPSSLAYVIYTSGSTGKPKGVMVEHRNVVNFLWAMRPLVKLTVDDTLISVTSPSFDIFGLELYLPLVVGARVMLATKLQTLDGANLNRLISRQRSPVMQATPSMWSLLTDAGGPPQGRLRVLCGGEALPVPLATKLCERSAEVWNLYGPTETTIWSTAVQLNSGDPITIGRPIANTQLYVLDEHGKPTPVGVPGELFIGGDGVARGYFGRPDLTAERFVPDPFSKQASARMYRTGDRVRFRPDGTVEFIGRIDNQVKVRGYRVELSEIEATLASHPDIKAAAVVLRNDPPGPARLVGYIVAVRPSGLPFGELRAHLKKTLPEYMLPPAFVYLDALPLTPNGKIDRKALPAPERLHTDHTQGQHHLSPIEAAVAGVWSRVLEVEPAANDDDFFELGGNSLLLVKLLASLKAEFGVDFPLRAAFESPTLASFAHTLEDLIESRDRGPASRPFSSVRDRATPSSNQ